MLTMHIAQLTVGDRMKQLEWNILPLTFDSLINLPTYVTVEKYADKYSYQATEKSCFLNTNFVSLVFEKPSKFIIAKLLIHNLGSS